MGLLTLLNCYILLYVLLNYSTVRPTSSMLFGEMFFYDSSLTLAYVGQTRWPQPGETVSERRRKVSVCQALRLRPEKTSEVKS